MRQKLRFKLLIVGLLIWQQADAKFFGKHEEGWHWYKEEIKEPEKLINSAEPTRDPTAQIKAYQKKIEEKLHAALLSPTVQNIRTYQHAQKELLDRSELFSQQWMKVVYSEPELDHTLKVPVNYKARHIYLDQHKSLARQTIAALAQEYGLFLFVRHDCKYCEHFMPIVQEFAKRYEWDVIVINEDGAPIPGFKNVMANNGLLEQWQVKAVPALFAVDPKNSEVVPLAYGLVSIDEIEQRIVTLRSRREY